MALFSASYHFILSSVHCRNGCWSPRTAVILVNFCKQKYLYRQGQYPTPWIGKCHIPIAQRLEQSTRSRTIMGSSLIRDVLFSTSQSFDCFKYNRIERCCSRAAGISCINLYKTQIQIFISPQTVSLIIKWKVSHTRSTEVQVPSGMFLFLIHEVLIALRTIFYIRNVCCYTRMVDISYVDLYKHKGLNRTSPICHREVF